MALSTVIQTEQRVAGGHEIAHLWNELDQAVGAEREFREPGNVEREHDAGPLRCDGTRRLAFARQRNVGPRSHRTRDGLRVHRLDDGLAPGADSGQDTDRPESLAHLVDHVEEDTDARDAAVHAQPHGDLGHRVVDACQRRKRVREREDEEASART